MKSPRAASRLAAAVALSCALSGMTTAAAVPPDRTTVDPPPNIVQDNGEACGFPVRWAIDISAVDITNFYDSEGRRVRQQAHITEDNTITNLNTGLTLREGPDHFMQTVYFGEDGRPTHFVATGLAANVFGTDVKDVGRVVWLPGTNEVVFSAGKHDLREAIQFGTFADALVVFCDVLS
jgi:hypothetical protein